MKGIEAPDDAAADAAAKRARAHAALALFELLISMITLDDATAALATKLHALASAFVEKAVLRAAVGRVGRLEHKGKAYKDLAATLGKLYSRRLVSVGILNPPHSHISLCQRLPCLPGSAQEEVSM